MTTKDDGTSTPRPSRDAGGPYLLKPTSLLSWWTTSIVLPPSRANYTRPEETSQVRSQGNLVPSVACSGPRSAPIKSSSRVPAPLRRPSLPVLSRGFPTDGSRGKRGRRWRDLCSRVPGIRRVSGWILRLLPERLLYLPDTESCLHGVRDPEGHKPSFLERGDFLREDNKIHLK